VELVRADMMAPGANVRRKMKIWDKALESDLAGIIQDRIGEEMDDLIRLSHRYEWDLVIVKNLESLRKKDRVFDAKMAMLIYYNEDIDEEETLRRWGTLNPIVVNNVINLCNKWAHTPWPESWHFGKKVRFTQEMWDSIDVNWERAEEPIKDIPKRHLERRRLEAPIYWKQLRDLWSQNFGEKLAYFKKMNDEFGNKPMKKLMAIEKSCLLRIRTEEAALMERIRFQETELEEFKESTQTMIGHLPKERRWEQNGRPTAEVLKLKSDMESRIRVTKC
jgi:hypothetical protein